MASITDNISVVNLVKCVGLNKAVETMMDKCNTKASKSVLYSQIDRFLKKHKLLLKNGSRTAGQRNLEMWENTAYMFPVPKSSTTVPAGRTDPFDCNNDDPRLIAMAYKDVAEKIAVELSDKQEELEVFDHVQDKIDKLDTEIEIATDRVSSQKKDLKRTTMRENYWRSKYRKLEDQSEDIKQMRQLQEHIDTLTEQVHTLTNQVECKKEIIKTLSEENTTLHLEVDNLRQSQHETVYVFNDEKKEYIPELHTCVYTLLNHHVATEHVSPVIQSVLKLTNKNANKLPSKSTIKNWSLERGLLARRQIGETASEKNTTLHTDESSKYGSKWGSFASRDSDGNYLLLGMRDMATKSSADTLDTFKEILTDIDNASTNEVAGKQILSNIKNTMSDKAATEKRFNEIIKEYRDTVLPEVVDNYDRMNEESKMAISHMNNFFCGLHSLVHMAETSQKTLYQVENDHFDGEIPIDFHRATQSGTVRLLFTACKAFARRGDQKNGCHGTFSTYIKTFLEENGFLSLPLQPLRGNRFNILFVNAGHIFYFKDKMIDFLRSTPTLNGLLQSVLKDLEQDFFIAGLKALGLISKLVTTPLWNVIENKDISMNDMARRYLDLEVFLQDSVHNIEGILQGEAQLYHDVSIKKDKVFEKLVAPDESIDNHVVTILSVLLPALAKLVRHEFGDHLPGGIHENVDLLSTKSADKHNKFPERVFAYVDHLLAQKPNISTLALEAQITFSLNKTDQWLANKSIPEINDLVMDSRREVKRERERFKKREKDIREKRLENQRIQFEKKAQLEEKRIRKLEKETIDIQYFGLWQSGEQIEDELGMIESVKEKEEALKAQLRFRKNVFQQRAESSTYAFSKVVEGKRVNLNVYELKENVGKLVRGAYEVERPTNDATASLLVGKRIKQKFLNEAGNVVWSPGRVISQVPGFPRWFNVKFDSDPAIYSDNLADHYRAKEIEIVATPPDPVTDQ